MKKISITRSIFYLTSTYASLFAYDTPQFYKARHFQGEPRFEKKDLITFDTSFTGGKTSHAYNQCGEKIPLLYDLPYKLKDRVEIITDWQH